MRSYASSYGNFIFSFKINGQTFPEGLDHLTFPQVVSEKSSFFTSSLAFAAITMAPISPSDRCVVMSRGFNLHLPNGYWCRTCFHGLFAICISSSFVFSFSFLVNEFKISIVLALFYNAGMLCFIVIHFMILSDFLFNPKCYLVICYLVVKFIRFLKLSFSY